MKLTDEKIAAMKPADLFSKETILSVFDIEENEERTRAAAMLEVKAKELGVQQQFRKVIKAYNNANEQLAGEYKRRSAARNAPIILDYESNGKPTTSIDNFLQVLKHDKKFEGLKFNLLTYSPEQVRNGNAERWSDSDDAETRRYIEKKYKFHNQQKCDDALRIVFAENEYHPIRDLVDNIEWDGVERIPTFLHKWAKCEDTPYTREVSRLMFAGGINRLYNPGCKFDDMPVLIGTHQGEGKSTLVRWLAMKDEYFAEVNEFDGQRGIESLEGAWICEVSELLAMTKVKEQEAVKSFLTRLNDRYRMPFDKRVTDHPRQCLFIGTTNKEQFLTDKTGGRRFYPVKVNQTGYELFDHEEEVKADIKQCWAEARVKMQNGEMPPYADRTLIKVIKEKQNNATEDDYRQGMIEDYLTDKKEICILELWQNALDMGNYSKPTKKESNEISLMLQSMEGWEKQEKPKRFGAFGLQRWWKNTNAESKAPDLGGEDELPF